MDSTSSESVDRVVVVRRPLARHVPLPIEPRRAAIGPRSVVWSGRQGLAPGGAGPVPIADPVRVAAVLTLLQRYAQQDRTAVDVFAVTGAGTEVVAFDIDILPETTGEALIREVELRLAQPEPTTMPDAVSASNVAITLLADGAIDVVSDDSYDLNFVLGRAAGGPWLRLVYDPELFLAAGIDRLLASAAIILDALLRDPTVAVGRLPLLGHQELHGLTAGQDSGTSLYPAEPVSRIFEALAARQPTAIAVRYRDERLTYAQLDRESSRLAGHLVGLGVGPDRPVAVCIPPCLHILPAILAIWKAGGVYLPLDPTHPEAYLRRMLEEARPVVVLTLAPLAPLSAGFPQFCLDRDQALIADVPGAAAPPALTDAAYIFYTSGTTGKPKGVVATHGNLRQYIHSAIEKYGFGPTDIFVSLARYTFSISLFDLISPICCGASVLILDREQILAPAGLAAALETVTVVHAGPSLLGSLFRHLRATPSAPRALPKMRHASSGGDLIPPSILDEMKLVFPQAELFVIYGCTEVSCMGTTYAIPRDLPATRNFVGKPFPNVTLRVLDANRALMPFGAVGEICFAGDGIVRGYLDMPELTQDKFAAIDGRRFYRTGDVGRLHADGNLEILGRRDFQVQLRGIRIEIAGIEKTILALGLASQCAVIAKSLDEHDTRLIAFVVAPGVETLEAFRRALARELPDYMLPQHVVILDAMPLTPNGKLDRNRLVDLPLERQLAAAGSGSDGAALHDQEQAVIDVFNQVLGRQDIGRDSNFFDLGGSSILAIIALEELHRRLGVEIAPHIMFEHGTAAAIADRLRSAVTPESDCILLSPDGSRPPLFMLSGVNNYRRLARHLDAVCSVYALFLSREIKLMEEGSPINNVTELARDYFSVIRQQQPSGPYMLLGHSFSGLVAYEVSRMLRAVGEEVRLLTMIDSNLPERPIVGKLRIAKLGRLFRASPALVLAFFWRRVKESLGKQVSPLARVSQNEQAGPLRARRDRANLEAAYNFIPQITRYDGAVLLVTASERLRDFPLESPDCGWAQYMPALRIHSVASDHFRMMSDDPFVAEIAGHIIDCLTRLV